jgi:hypothetical protein
MSRHPGCSKETDHLKTENNSIGSIGITAIQRPEQGQQPTAADDGQAGGKGIARTPNTKQKACTSGLNKTD